MKINLGCGTDIKPGWMNIDILPVQHPNYIQRNLVRDGFPNFLEDVELIASTHFFEHLTDDEAIILMRSCRNILKEDGKFRIALPSFNKMVKAYLDNDWAMFDILPWDQFSNPVTRTLIDVCTYGVYQYGEHKSLWDGAKLLKILDFVGFKNPKLCKPDPAIDVMTELRVRYSIYAEATK